MGKQKLHTIFSGSRMENGDWTKGFLGEGDPVLPSGKELLKEYGLMQSVDCKPVFDSNVLRMIKMKKPKGCVEAEVFSVEQNHPNIWTVYGNLGARTYYGVTKNEAKKMYKEDVQSRAQEEGQ